MAPHLESPRSGLCGCIEIGRIAMTIEIEGQSFTPFPTDQEEKFKLISYHGRVAWLEFRFNVVFMDPFRKFLELDGQCYVWLCILSLATFAIDSLAKFEYTGKAAFVRFVEEFFPSGAFKERKLRLHDPRPDRKTKVAKTPAQHLYKFFRSSIAHDFCIDWDGVLHRETDIGLHLMTRIVCTELLSRRSFVGRMCLEN